MKVITTNLLNRFWKNGVKPIKEAVTGKLDASKVVNSLLATEEGFALDATQGKALKDQVDELNRKLKWKLLSDGLMGGVSVSIPSDADQIHIKANMTNNIILTIEIATIELSGNAQSYRSGYAQSANVNGMVAFGVSNTQITLTNGVLNGASVTPSWSVYYR